MKRKSLITLIGLLCLLALTFISCKPEIEVVEVPDTTPPTPITYKVHFDANGGEGTMSDQTFTCDVAQKLTKNAYTKSGFEFTGWKTEQNAGTSYTDEQTVKNLTTENGDVITLYAVWKDVTAPAPITDFSGVYNSTDKTIKLTWTEPGDSDYKEVKITYDGTTETVPKGTKTLTISNIVANETQYTFNAVTYDNAGNAGSKVECSVKATIIGDVLLNDGTKVSQADIETLLSTPEQKANAVAVVCGKNADGGPLGLGLKQSENALAWATDGTTAYQTNFTTIVCTPSVSWEAGAADKATFTSECDTDGRDNWSVIVAEYEKQRKTETAALEDSPTFKWVKEYGTSTGAHKELAGTKYATGWYIPSLPELCGIYKNRTVLDKVLKKLGQKGLGPNVYWSSSQYDSYDFYAWFMDFNNGNIYNTSKSDHRYVCCIRAF